MKVKNPFENWITPLSLEEFENNYLHQKLFYTRGAKKQGLITWPDLNNLLDQASIWSPETLKLYKNAQPVACAEYCTSVPDSQGRSVLKPHPPFIQKWIAQGASLVLNDIAELTPALREMSSALRTLFSARVQINLYASMQGIQAFPSHFDPHDVFVFQSEGEKTWRIYENRVDAPINHPKFNLLAQEHHDRAKGSLLKELTLQAGDFLYLPRGFYHEALASKGPSLHVTFGVTRPVGLDILSLLFEEGISHPFFRQYLTPSSLAEQGKALAEYASEILKDAHFIQKVHTLFEVEKAASPYSFPYNNHSVSFRVRRAGLSLEYHSHQFWLTSPTREVPVPKGKEKLVEWILQHEEITLEDLVKSPLDVKKQEWEAMIRDLLQMGILA